MVTPRNEWMSFREFFDQAAHSGIDQLEAAEALLAKLKANKGAIRVAGTLRKWDPLSDAETHARHMAEMERANIASQLDEICEGSPDSDLLFQKFQALTEMIEGNDGWNERLPRDTQLKVLPKSIWNDFSSVFPNLTSTWIDDPHEPEQSAHIDWIAGVLEMQFWSTPSVGGGKFVVQPVREEYSNLSAERARAKEMLKQLAGSPETRGAPAGLRDPVARKISDSVVEAIRSGDVRTPGRIAGTLLPRELSADQAERMQRNIVRDVKRRLSDPANSDSQ